MATLRSVRSLVTGAVARYQRSAASSASVTRARSTWNCVGWARIQHSFHSVAAAQGGPGSGRRPRTNTSPASPSSAAQPQQDRHASVRAAVGEGPGIDDFIHSAGGGMCGGGGGGDGASRAPAATSWLPHSRSQHTQAATSSTKSKVPTLSGAAQVGVTEAPELPSLGERGAKYKNEDTYYYTRKRPQEAWSLIPDAYRDPDYFAVEQVQVISKTWVAVAPLDKVRNWGDTVIATIAGQPVFVTRSKKGELHGFYNVCRHRGAKLIRKNGNYRVLSCPYHRWGYAGDGRLLATPLFKGDGIQGHDEPEMPKDVKEALSTEHVVNFHKKDYGLFPIRTESQDGIVYINLSGDAPPLMDCLGDVPAQVSEHKLDELVVVREQELTVKANWKLMIENFSEYMHLPSVHPALCDVSPVDKHKRCQGIGNNTAFVTHPMPDDDPTPANKNVLPAFPGLGEKNRETAWFHALFPNTFYFGFPHSWFIVHVFPVSPTESREIAYMLAHPDTVKNVPDAKEKLDKLWDFLAMTNDEDIAVCESVQEGIMCGPYQGGRMTFKFEEPVWRFQQMCIDHMVGKPRVWGGDADGTHEYEWDVAAGYPKPQLPEQPFKWVDGAWAGEPTPEWVAPPTPKVRRWSKEALAVLENAFAHDPLPSREAREALASELEETHERVANWFRTRRAKAKKAARVEQVVV